ncbi:MAG: TRAP transporter large permease [Gammaproteobacteria bacterium]|nr:TRAP transporter large permease [Gammaproteobacteria bacterium]
MFESFFEFLADNPLPMMVVLLLLQMALRVPIAVAMGLSSVAYLLVTDTSLVLVVQTTVSKLNSFTLLAIPFFVLAGELMNLSGISVRLINLAKTFVGHIRGGLGHVNVLTSTLLAGMSGSAAADAAMTCRVLVPVMEREGYPRPYAAAITAASATMGPIIPPSIPMILVGVVNELSIGRLFFGGVIPGLLMTVGLMLMVYMHAVRRNFPRDPRANLKQVMAAMYDAVLPMLSPVIILGGMMSGFFTPTEAAVIAVAYMGILGGLVYRTITLRGLYEALLNTVSITARIMFIVALAGLFGWILTAEQVVQRAGDYLHSNVSSPALLLLYLNLLFLFLGCFLNLVTLVVLLSPVVFPLIDLYGIDPIHFGVVMVLNLMIGQLTPPVGLMSFVVLGVTGVNLGQFLRALWPFFLVLVVVLLLITYIPWLVLVVPDLIMGPRLG